MTLKGHNADGTSGDAERDARLDLLYREAGGEMPPARLDAAILAAAHREVGARPRPMSSTLRRWRVPISIAAVVVLSVSLVTLVQEEGGDRLTDIPPATLPPAPDQEASPPAPAAMADPERHAPQRRVPAVAPAPPPAAAASQPKKGEQSLPDLPAEAAPAPSARVRDDAAGGSRGMAAGSPSSVEASRPGAQALERPAAAKEADTTMAGRLSSALKAPASSAATPVPSPVPQAAVPDQRRSMEPSGANFLQRPPIWSDLERQPPEKWLERIEELHQSARTAELNDLLAEFRKRFPAHPLPAWVR
jgi:hypothetical protein